MYNLLRKHKPNKFFGVDDDLEDDDDGSELDETDTDKDDDSGDEDLDSKSTDTDEDKDDEPKSKDSRMVPRSRLNQKIDQLKGKDSELAAKDEEIEKLKQQINKGSNGEDKDGDAQEESALIAKLHAASKRQKKAIEDDDEEGTLKAAEEIANINADIAQRRIGTREEIDPNDVTAAAVDQIEWKQELKETYKKFPMLNANGDEPDEGLITEVLDMQLAFMNSGESKTESLQKAVRYVMSDAGIKAESEAAPSLEDTKTNLKKRSTTKKAAKKAPDISKAGEAGNADLGDIDIHNISDDELEALPDSKLKELQGDMV